MSTRLEALIRDPGQRTYLAAVDGFWADVVLRECLFLEDRGYRLDKIAFHQKGDYITYRGSHGEITFEFFPEGDWIGGFARLKGGFLSFEGDLDLFARVHEPTAVFPPKLPLSPEIIERTVQFWASALRSGGDMV